MEFDVTCIFKTIFVFGVQLVFTGTQCMIGQNRKQSMLITINSSLIGNFGKNYIVVIINYITFGYSSTFTFTEVCKCKKLI